MDNHIHSLSHFVPRNRAQHNIRRILHSHFPLKDKENHSASLWEERQSHSPRPTESHLAVCDLPRSFLAQGQSTFISDESTLSPSGQTAEAVALLLASKPDMQSQNQNWNLFALGDQEEVLLFSYRELGGSQLTASNLDVMDEYNLRRTYTYIVLILFLNHQYIHRKHRL